MQTVCEMILPNTLSEIRQGFGLTPRELHIIALVVAGYTNKDIARKLGIVAATIKYHLADIFEKLGVSNRIELVLFAAHHGLTDQD